MASGQVMPISEVKEEMVERFTSTVRFRPPADFARLDEDEEMRPRRSSFVPERERRPSSVHCTVVPRRETRLGSVPQRQRASVPAEDDVFDAFLRSAASRPRPSVERRRGAEADRYRAQTLNGQRVAEAMRYEGAYLNHYSDDRPDLRLHKDRYSLKYNEREAKRMEKERQRVLREHDKAAKAMKRRPTPVALHLSKGPMIQQNYHAGRGEFDPYSLRRPDSRDSGRVRPVERAQDRPDVQAPVHAVDSPYDGHYYPAEKVDEDGPGFVVVHGPPKEPAVATEALATAPLWEESPRAKRSSSDSSLHLPVKTHGQRSRSSSSSSSSSASSKSSQKSKESKKSRGSKKSRSRSPSKASSQGEKKRTAEFPVRRPIWQSSQAGRPRSKSRSRSPSRSPERREDSRERRETSRLAQAELPSREEEERYKSARKEHDPRDARKFSARPKDLPRRSNNSFHQFNEKREDEERDTMHGRQKTTYYEYKSTYTSSIRPRLEKPRDQQRQSHNSSQRRSENHERSSTRSRSKPSYATAPGRDIPPVHREERAHHEDRGHSSRRPLLSGATRLEGVQEWETSRSSRDGRYKEKYQRKRDGSVQRRRSASVMSAAVSVSTTDPRPHAVSLRLVLSMPTYRRHVHFQDGS